MTARLACLICLILPASLQAQARAPMRMAIRCRRACRPAQAWAALGRGVGDEALAGARGRQSLAYWMIAPLRLWDVASGKQLQLHRDEHLDSLRVLVMFRGGIVPMNATRCVADCQRISHFSRGPNNSDRGPRQPIDPSQQVW